MWEIQRKLVEDDARPVIFYPTGVTCWQPQLKGMTIMVNSIYNGSRFEDLWLINNCRASARREEFMRGRRDLLGGVAGLFAVMAATGPAFAQKSGGILQMLDFASPASMSIHEESTITAGIPMMGVFNNLVVFDQHVAQNSLQSIVPDLATSWAWSEDGKELTFELRQGVKWHDGKPFTAADVKCTWDRLRGAAADKFRINPRKAWYRNVDEITTNGDYEVTFHLKRPQPYLIALLASGQSPVYPCHVSTAQMRTHPIGTGPFKFVEYKPNEHIRVTRNPGLLEEGQTLSRRHRIHDHRAARRPGTSPSSPASSISSSRRSRC